ncbi:hypothetical protein N9Z85_02540 [Akkermansiaceae bacterium]|nr:hypothetical protein [Akkermansiaceae bacterium]
MFDLRDLILGDPVEVGSLWEILSNGTLSRGGAAEERDFPLFLTPQQGDGSPT